MTDNHQPTSPSHRIRHEGPRNHYLSYIVSILLTMLAFAVVLYGGLDPAFIMIFIVTLALVQAVFQLIFWMHMKDRGIYMRLSDSHSDFFCGIDSSSYGCILGLVVCTGEAER